MEVEIEKGAERGNVMIQNLLMVEIIVEEMIQRKCLKTAIQMIVQVGNYFLLDLNLSNVSNLYVMHEAHSF